MTVKDTHPSNAEEHSRRNSNEVEPKSLGEAEVSSALSFPEEEESPKRENSSQNLSSNEIYEIFTFHKISDLPGEKIFVEPNQKRSPVVTQEPLLDIFVEPLDVKESGDDVHKEKISKETKSGNVKNNRREAYLKCRSLSSEKEYFPESGVDSTDNRLLDIIFEPIKDQREILIYENLPKTHQKLPGLTPKVHEEHFSSKNNCALQDSQNQSFLKTHFEAQSLEQSNSFWVSCGLYPQQMLISLAGLTHVDRLSLSSYNVRRITLEKSVNSKPTEFQIITNQEAGQTEGKLQTISVSTDQISAAYLRLTILEGHDHFCSLHSLIITGAEDRNGVLPNSSNKRVRNFPVVQQIPNEPYPSELEPLTAENPQETEDTDDDVDNASTYTQHGGSTLLNDFADDDAGSSLQSGESDH